MLVLIDGYNVTMRDPRTSASSKETQRNSLIGRLRFSAKQIAPGGSVVIVFDSRQKFGIDVEDEGPVKVVYAADADDEILRRCAEVRGAVAVVTDDMRLRARISQEVGRRVAFRSTEEVTAVALRASRETKRPGLVAREDGLPSGAADITEELSRLWLPDDES